MMVQGDFDLIPVQRYTGSVKQVLKQTMLDQDVMFRNQVHELHRLYRVQQSMMKDFGWEECSYKLWNPKLQSSLLPLTNPTRHESPAKQTRISLTSKVNAGPHLKMLFRVILPSREEGRLDNDLIFEALRFYVNSTGRTYFTNRTFYCSQNVIDLEESDERISNGYAKHETVSIEKHDFQGSGFPDPIISTSMKKGLFHETTESSSFQEYSECCQEQTSSSAGTKGSLNDAPSDDLFSKMQTFASYKGGQLDLNKAHLDDSSCCSDDHMFAYPSRASSDGGSNGFIGGMQDGTCPSVFQKKDIDEFSNEASDMIKEHNHVHLAHVDFNRKNMSTDPMIRSPAIISEDLGCCGGELKNNIVELKSKLSGEVSSEKSEVESVTLSCTDLSQNAFQYEHGKSPASCKSCCISDNDSSSAKTANSGIMNQYLKTRLESQVADVLADEHEQRTLDGSNLKDDCYNKEEESGKVDILIQEAAESLIRIYTEQSACNQEMENERKVQPLCSFDSFELIAMNLTESNVDDDSVSSKPFEISDMEAKEFGLRLRRGRRMKDFQREILPSLTSLSRPEILEDINIMEGVLRSREYRKMRAKMAVHGEDWSAPVRSRRSRLSYAGRRNYS
eukprot:XP_002529784.2 uncharacterized protein LOC8279641 [Ricinus communis]